jgi:hypothetical protein
MNIDEREERKRQWLKGLKPGDLVAYDRGGFYRGSYTLAKVDKVTKANGGTIIVGNAKFDMYGRERRSGSAWSGYIHLEEPTPEVLERVRCQRLIAKLEYLISPENLKKLSSTALQSAITALGGSYQDLPAIDDV